MKYLEFVNLYESIAKTSSRLEKTSILSHFLKKLKSYGNSKYIYLLKGRVFPDYDSREFGISNKLAIKSIAKGSGTKDEEILKKLKKLGDLGEVAESFFENRKQSTLYRSTLSTDKVFSNLKKLVSIEGHGSVVKKLSLISELFNNASGKEAKYITRTLLSDLRIGMADGVIRDALAESFFEGESEMKQRIETAYDLSNDYAVVFEASSKGKKELEKITITPGKPMKVMLPIKINDMKEAFRICGRPLALEHKYDGFRVLINKDEKGAISLYTRRLDNVSKQFPDIIETINKYLKAKSFILDSEIVGFNPKTKKYLPFEAISQRIKRKYEIDKLIKTLPVEINVFDILYYNSKVISQLPFKERRKILVKIIESKKLKIRPSFQIVTDSEEKALEFYKKALDDKEEGVMIKNLEAPYHAGRRVGYIVKMKPDSRDLDLVIVGAEYGSGKRAGWLTSYIVACKSNSEFLEVGRVSSGLKEIAGQEGTTYKEMTKLLKPLIVKEVKNVVSIKPKIIVSVNYQNIQHSPSYNSGFALRFPRITHYRPERSTFDITTLGEIKKEANRANIWGIQ